MMQTSYFQNPKLLGKKAVSIARYAPRGWKGQRFTILAPSKELFQDSKNGLSWYEFKKRFNAQLKYIDAKKVYDSLEGCVLCCWEKNASKCHRRLVASWFEKSLNIVVPEL